MRILVVMLLCLSLVGMRSHADQNDERLGGLFLQLLEAVEEKQIRDINDKIWEYWFHSDDPETQQLMQLASEYEGNRRYRHAIEIYGRVIKINPDYAEGWNRRATLRYALGNFAGSQSDITRVLALEPRHFGALAGQGHIYYRQQSLGKALISYQKALQINPHLVKIRKRVRLLLKNLRNNII